MAHEASEDGDYDEANRMMDVAMKAMTEGFNVRSQLMMALNQSEYDAAISAWEEYKSKYEVAI
jgi:cellobiose-specific phosphotransferase system component IIA